MRPLAVPGSPSPPSRRADLVPVLPPLVMPSPSTAPSLTCTFRRLEDGGLKRFIKDRQAKKQWDDADEAEFIKGASSSRPACPPLG